MSKVTLTREQKEEVRHAVQGRIMRDYGDFYEMESERKDMFYTFLGILNKALDEIPEGTPVEENNYKPYPETGVAKA